MRDSEKRFFEQDHVQDAQKDKQQLENKEYESGRQLLASALKALRNPLGKISTVALGMLLFAGSGKLRTVEIGQSYGRPVPIEFNLPDQTHVAFKGWESFDFDHLPTYQIVPESQGLKNILDSRDFVLTDLGLYPIKFENIEVFEKWIEQQYQDPGTLGALDLQSVEQATPKKLVELAVAITAKNLIYSRDLEKLEKSVKEPMDKVLMESLPADCTQYAVATETIFKALKQKFPEKLQNVYVGTTSMAPEKNPVHTFNRVVIITSPSGAEISFVDATAADVSWGKSYLVQENFVDILSEWRQQGIVDPRTYISLKYEYLANHDSLPLQAWQLIHEDFKEYTSDMDVYADSQTLKFLERFANETKNKIEIKTARSIIERLNRSIQSESKE